MPFVSALKQIARTPGHCWSGLIRPAADGGLSPILNVAYASPMLAKGLLTGGYGVLQGVYAKYYGMDLVLLAGIMMFVRLFDAVTDPVVGYWSDLSRQRAGSRKRMISIGGIVFALSGYLLFAPLHISLWYVLSVMIFLEIGKTIFTAPYNAWGSDLAPTSAAKSKIFTASAIMGGLSWMLFYGIPFLPIFATREIIPETLELTGILAGMVMAISLTICMRTVPETPVLRPHRTSADGDSWQVLRRLARSVLLNPPMLLIYVAHSTFSFALGAWFSMTFLYVDVYLGFGGAFAEISLMGLFVFMVAAQFWNWFSIRFGKKLGLVCGSVVLGGSFLYALALGPESATYGHVLFLMLLNSFGLGSGNVLSPAYMSEVVDYTSLKFGMEYSGSYFAVFGFIEKVGIAMGMAAALGIAGMLGFDAGVGAQTASGTFGMKLAIGGITLGASLLHVALILMNPMTNRRHHIIRKRLDALASRQSGIRAKQ